MNRVVLFLVVGVLCGSLFVSCALAQEKKEPDTKVKPNPDRLKGMKAAVADIEAGTLKQVFSAGPVDPLRRKYSELLKKEYGVESRVVVLSGNESPSYMSVAEMESYNAVMRIEIEFRFGAGILDKLMKKAKEATPGDE